MLSTLGSIASQGGLQQGILYNSANIYSLPFNTNATAIESGGYYTVGGDLKYTGFDYTGLVVTSMKMGGRSIRLRTKGLDLSQHGYSQMPIVFVRYTDGTTTEISVPIAITTANYTIEEKQIAEIRATVYSPNSFRRSQSQIGYIEIIK